MRDFGRCTLRGSVLHAHATRDRVCLARVRDDPNRHLQSDTCSQASASYRSACLFRHHHRYRTLAPRCLLRQRCTSQERRCCLVRRHTPYFRRATQTRYFRRRLSSWQTPTRPSPSRKGSGLIPSSVSSRPSRSPMPSSPASPSSGSCLARTSEYVCDT